MTPRPPTGDSGAQAVPLARLSSPVLAARSEELELLTRAAAHPPAVAVVEGEAGVGKTRLVEELTATLAAEGRRVLVGHCHPLAEPFPLGPVVEAVRALGPEVTRLRLSPLAGALRPVLPEIPGLPPRPEALGDPGMERHRLWRALYEVLAALGPTVLVLEDLHWSDEATPQFLTFLLPQQPPDLTVVLTSRLEGISHASLRALASRLPSQTSAARVHLQPLSPADVKVMVGAILETDLVSDEFASYLHQRTAGIPLVVEEVLRLLVDRRDIVLWHGRWARRALNDVRVPDAVRDSFLERLVALGAGARRLVEAAAVLEWPAPDTVLGAVAGLDDAAARDAVTEALASGLLRPMNTGYACRHALAAQAVYEAVAGPERARLHERAALALEAHARTTGYGPDLPARLAHHWRHCQQVERWVERAAQAAELAVSLGDPGTATSLLLDAVTAPGLDGPTVSDLALSLSEAAVDSLAQAEAIDAIRLVLDRADIPGRRRGELLANLGALLHQAGRASEANAALKEAVAHLADRPDASAHLMTALALPWVADQHVDEHLEWLRRADALSRPSDPGRPTAVLAGDRATVLMALGDPTAWASIPSPPAADDALIVRQNWVRLCTNLAVNAFYLGHDVRAASFVADGRRVAGEAGYKRMDAALGTADLLLRWSGGKWEGLEASAAEIRRAHPDVPSDVQAAMVLGLVALARGNLAEAETCSREAAQRAGPCGALPVLAAAAAGLARSRLARGDAAAAVAQVLVALEAVAAKDIWFWATAAMPTAVSALVARGEPDRADSWVRRFATGIEGRDAPAARAALGMCAGLLAEAGGSPEPATRHFTESAAAWAALGRPYDAALASEGAARCLLAVGGDGGSATGTTALGELRRLGASWDEARVRRLLREHGVSVPYPRRAREGYGDQLSPREEEVVDLAATGLTSARIAKRLFLSPRTVDHHLERALRKLGIASRKELVTQRDSAVYEQPDRT